MTDPPLAGLTLPSVTDQPVPLADLPIGAHRVRVWADRPARGLTRIMLVDDAGRGCGDAVLRGDTLTVTLPAEWSAAERVAAAGVIAHLVYQVPAGA
ncbi:hypothetical protein V6V47_13660 [Micromonospora sp. CPCC 205539]|uniref:hypothetical protein n=1 Tax=Micromonospora sp. CPCC 205539 TaxID=3122408 RepID=UPI002FEF445C